MYQIPLIGIVLLSIVVTLAPAHAYSRWMVTSKPIVGNVIDADTKEPLEGRPSFASSVPSFYEFPRLLAIIHAVESLDPANCTQCPH